MITFDAMAALPYRYGKPSLEAAFKTVPEDFLVEELLGYEPTVEAHNEHLWLKIEKRQQNSQWVAKRLAQLLGCKLHDVGYAGLKDRQAVTQQWFSVPSVHADRLAGFELDGVKLLEQQPASKKIRRGRLAGNRFNIRLRGLADVDQFKKRFEMMKLSGVPNYYADQRFGIAAGNLLRAERWRQKRYRPKQREERAFLISAMRAWLFNLQAAEAAQGGSAESGYLPGRYRNSLPGVCEGVFANYESQWRWLQSLGCEMMRRPLTVVPNNASCAIEGDDAVLSFELPAGSYATAVLRELVRTQ